jgi:arylsulfatase A-like enzyme
MKTIAGLALPALIACSAFAAEKPNVLLIVSDDQGYADVGFQGSKDIPTPHLDRLARAGLRCTSGYVTHPFCSPTRAALMTGRYQQRFGHENNPLYDPNDHREGLPTSERLLPAFLSEAGYVTGWIGKWHLGAAPEFSPLKRGFKETFGFIGGGHRYQSWKVNPAVEYQVPILRNGEPVEVTNHLTVAFGEEAAAFIRRHKAEPWFLYLAFNAPHMPHEPTPERLARFSSITNATRRAYAAQVSLLDDAIGVALAALRDTRQTERTLVFFFSDNGGPIAVNGSSNTPLRSGKGSVYEGGVRVPFLVSWPGRLPAGRDYAQPVSSVDVFATALAVAGEPMPADREYDSVNLLPFLAGEKSGTPHDRLFWRTGNRQWAVRQGNAKLVRQSGMSDELYDLSADISETSDLAAAKSDACKQLASALDAWNKELVPPAFPGLGARQQGKAKAKQKGRTPD